MRSSRTVESDGWIALNFALRNQRPSSTQKCARWKAAPDWSESFAGRAPSDGYIRNPTFAWWWFV